MLQIHSRSRLTITVAVAMISLFKQLFPGWFPYISQKNRFYRFHKAVFPLIFSADRRTILFTLRPLQRSCHCPMCTCGILCAVQLLVFLRGFWRYSFGFCVFYAFRFLPAHRLLCQARNAIFSPAPLRGRQKYLQFGSGSVPSARHSGTPTTITTVEPP